MTLSPGCVLTCDIASRSQSHGLGAGPRINPYSSERRLATEVRKKSALGRALCNAVIEGDELWWMPFSRVPQPAKELMAVVCEEIDRERNLLDAATARVQQAPTARRL